MEYDLIVIGAGMAGLNAVDRAAGDGRRIALIERGMFGGTCPTRGCIPSKALIRSAEIAHEARRAGEFGVRVGEVTVDFAAVMDRVRAIIRRGSDGARAWAESLPGVEVVDGDAAITAPGTVAVAGRELRSPRILIATGASPARPPIPGLADVPHWTSDDLLQATELPGRLLVVGAGPIALELGQAMRRLGSEVTLVDVAPELLPDAEAEVAGELRRILEQEEGLRILTGATIRAATAGPVLHVDVDGEPMELEGDVVLVATGRDAAVAGLGIEHAGIVGDRTGIPVDAHLATVAPGVYAAGDVVGPPYGAFTHVARRMGRWAAEHMLGLGPGGADPDVGPAAIFTDPELASIGLTERAARVAGHDVAVATSSFRGGKSRAWGVEYGLAKAVVERGTRRLLGVHVLAYHAADLIHPVAVAMAAPGGVADPLTGVYHIHPTLGEVVRSAVAEAAG